MQLRVTDLFMREVVEGADGESAPPPPPPRRPVTQPMPPSPPGRPVFRLPGRGASPERTSPSSMHHDDRIGEGAAASSSSHLELPPPPAPPPPSALHAEHATQSPAAPGLGPDEATSTTLSQYPKQAAPPPPPRLNGDRRFEGSHSMHAPPPPPLSLVRRPSFLPPPLPQEPVPANHLRYGQGPPLPPRPTELPPTSIIARQNFATNQRASGMMHELRPAVPEPGPAPELPPLQVPRTVTLPNLPEFDDLYDEKPPPPPPIRPVAMKPPPRKKSRSPKKGDVPVPSLHILEPTTDRHIPVPLSKTRLDHAPPAPPTGPRHPSSLTIVRQSLEDKKEMGIKPPEYVRYGPTPPSGPPPDIGGRTLAKDAFERLGERKRMVELKAKKAKAVIPNSVAVLSRSLVIFMALWVSIVGSFYTCSLGLNLRPKSTIATIISFFVGMAAFLLIFEAIKCVCITLVALSKEESKRRQAIKEARRIRMTLKSQVLEEKARVRGLPRFSHGLTG